MNDRCNANYRRRQAGLLPALFVVLVSGISLLRGQSDDGLIFPYRSEHTHSSSIIQTPGGNLLACWYAGSGERRANDVRIEGAVRSSGPDGNWSAPFILVDTPNLPDCNPVLFRDRLDRIWLFWVVPIANRWENSVLKYRRASSCDESGRPVWDWQDSIHLTPGQEFAEHLRNGFRQLGHNEDLWAEYALPYSRLLVQAAEDPYKRQTGWMTRNHPLTLSGGRIVLPLYSDGFNVSMTAYSDDDGETWSTGAPIVGLGPIQPSVVADSDGNLTAFMRDSGGAPARILVSHSHDKGLSWTPATDSSMPNPGSSMEVVSDGAGNWIMIYNRSETSRNNLWLAVSDDQGQSWKDVRELESGDSFPDARYSYPSMILAGGKLHMTWSVAGPRGESIRHKSMAWPASGN